MALPNLWQKKREESKSQKCKSKADVQKKSKCVNYKEKVKVHKRRVRQERSSKSSPQDMVSGHTGTPKSRKTSLRMKKVKKGDFCFKHLFQGTFWENSILKTNKIIFYWLSFETSMNNCPYSQNCSHSSKGQEYLKIF